jgi:DNA repair protein RadC
MPTLHEQLSVYRASSLSVLELFCVVLAASLATLPSPSLHKAFSRLVKDEGWLRLGQASLDELQEAGLSESQAIRVVAMCERSRRLALYEVEPYPQIRSVDDSLRLLRPFMSHLNQETFRVLVLNSKNQVVENKELYRGTVFGTQFRLAEILCPAIVRNCPALLVAHHPSGDPEPSE